MNIELTENSLPDSLQDAATAMTRITSARKETITSEESTSSMTSTTARSTATQSPSIISLLDMNGGYEMEIWDRLNYD